MEQLSDRILGLSESATIAMSQKSRELQEQGIDVINLSLGEPDFNTPDFVKDAAKEGIDQNYTKYMAVPGYLDLRQAISNKFKRDNNLDYSPEQIVVSTGAKQSITNVVLCLINEGDEVLLPSPYWVTYAEIVKLAGGVPVFIDAGIDVDFKITAEQLQAKTTSKTKLMIFSSPCNPTGTVYTKAELRGIADYFENNKNVNVIADEIYEHITFEGKHESLAQFDAIYDQVITINGVSKAFAMTGWRVGYMGAPLWIAKACTKMQGQFTSGTCSIGQRAAKAAVEADPKETSYMTEAFDRRRKLVHGLLSEIPGLKINMPKGAFYFFPDVSSYFGKSDGNTFINNSSDLSLYLLTEANVGLVTGDAFGSPNCIRISYAASDELLVEAMSRLKVALSKLN
ncbi:MAG: pyridoxal phosphate-dependent aminotransferase [Flavobacteriales bacterium]|nr:pyridoxal phosphate-dependent aminotransferase [Flavobacteriales bacterium]